MKVLKYCAIAFLQCSLIAITGTTVTAQDNHECFMLDAEGNPLDLGHLCGATPNNVNTVRTRSSHDSNSSGVIIIPIKRREGGTPIVDVKFNDRYVFEMLFDTGATRTLITAPMAKTLKLKSTGVVMAQTASSNAVIFETADIDSMGSGNLVKNNLNIVIGNTITTGLLGQDFYGMYDITIKYGSIELRKR